MTEIRFIQFDVPYVVVHGGTVEIPAEHALEGFEPFQVEIRQSMRDRDSVGKRVSSDWLTLAVWLRRTT